jgi:hypothetical protein
MSLLGCGCSSHALALGRRRLLTVAALGGGAALLAPAWAAAAGPARSTNEER